MEFGWDNDKATANLQKHGVSFHEAMTAFSDPLARIHDDREHSWDEPRELLLGQTPSGRLLLISFTEHVQYVRLISARPADRAERRNYEKIHWQVR